MGVEPVFQETDPRSMIGASIGITVVTSMTMFARAKAARKGVTKRARLILLSFLDQPCVGLNGWCPSRDAFGGGRYD
jgi:hypothetical protein